jgi:tryptophan synthase alpha subunit
VADVRKHTQLPIAIGFGVSNREQLKALGKMADAVIVGSALVRTIQDAGNGSIVTDAVRFVRGILGDEQIENIGGSI